MIAKKNNRKKNQLRKKPCVLCLNGTNYVDYKNVELLSRYTNQNCKIIPRRVTGCCKKHQVMVANAIKRARFVALMPFVKEF